MPLSVQLVDRYSLQLSRDGRPILTYRFGPWLRGPCIHPLRTPQGLVLSGGPVAEADPPGTRPPQQDDAEAATAEPGASPAEAQPPYGLYMGFSDINGVDFRLEGSSGGGRPIGRIATDGPPAIVEGAGGEAGEGTGRLAVRFRHRWLDPSGDALLLEDRVLAAIEPEEEGYGILEWKSDLTAPVEAVIGGDGEPASLRFRAADALAGGHLLNSRYEEDEATDGSPSEWCAYAGPQGGGLALMSARGNPDARPDFHTRSRPYGFIGPAIAHGAPVSLRAGETLSLHYRMVTFDGPIDPITLHMHYTAFMWG